MWVCGRCVVGHPSTGRDDQSEMSSIPFAGTNSFMWNRDPGGVAVSEQVGRNSKGTYQFKRSWCASSDISGNSVINQRRERRPPSRGLFRARLPARMPFHGTPLLSCRFRNRAAKAHRGKRVCEMHFCMWDEIVDRDNHSLNVRLLPDGRTSAKLVFVHIEDGSKSLAEVDSRDRVLDAVATVPYAH